MKTLSSCRGLPPVSPNQLTSPKPSPIHRPPFKPASFHFHSVAPTHTPKYTSTQAAHLVTLPVLEFTFFQTAGRKTETFRAGAALRPQQFLIFLLP